MKREIKFRCWDDFQKKMFDISSLKLPHREDLSPNVYLMQYTGIKDKNGKEIYEGDVVGRPNIHPMGAQVFEVVRWSKNRPGFVPFIRGINSKTQWAVYGNVYENHELIDNKV